MHLVIHLFVLRKQCYHLVASTWELQLVQLNFLLKNLLRQKNLCPHLCYGVLFHIQMIDQRKHRWQRALMPLMSKVLRRLSEMQVEFMSKLSEMHPTQLKVEVLTLKGGCRPKWPTVSTIGLRVCIIRRISVSSELEMSWHYLEPCNLIFQWIFGAVWRCRRRGKWCRMSISTLRGRLHTPVELCGYGQRDDAPYFLVAVDDRFGR